MRQERTGEQIVVDMAAGCEWWKLRASDLAPWIATLPSAVRHDDWNRLRWIGKPWDGASDIEVGKPVWNSLTDKLVQPVLTHADAELLLSELRRLISAMPILGVKVPDRRDFRICLAGPEDDDPDSAPGMLTIDFDLGDIVVPLCIKGWQLSPAIRPPMEWVACLMLQALSHAVRHRDLLVSREVPVRAAISEIMADLGHGAAPLWLRMEPLRFDDDPSKLESAPWVAIGISLDHNLTWVPHGSEGVRSVSMLRRDHRYRKAAHRGRATALARMAATGCSGWISDAALAVIEDHGVSPAETFRQMRKIGLGDDGAERIPPGNLATLSCWDGVLTASFYFRGGSYQHGRLLLEGNYPDAVETIARGRTLSAFVDHPALQACKGRVTRAKQHGGRLDLFHKPRLITVEQAERRWAVGRSGTEVGANRQIRSPGDRGCVDDTPSQADEGEP